jgi:multiple sugar transport system permease protein
MANYQKNVNTSPHYSAQLSKLWVGGMLTMIATIFTVLYLMPFANMALLSVKSPDQIVTSSVGSILPQDTLKFTYEGEEYDVYNVPGADGVMHQWILVKKGRASSEFIDPANPEAGVIVWEGSWRTLETATYLNPHFENFATAWNDLNFPKVFGNTLYIAIVGMVGTVISSICVGYAFARFPIPGKNILFIILIGTIILPGQVTLIPTFAFFSNLVSNMQAGMNSMGFPDPVYDALRAVIAWLPLTLPHFFSNAYNVFLLRQFFMTLPKELDEAAMIDGAGPVRILLQIILPMAWPAVITVGLFHFIFAWNDYFGPLIYLLSAPDLNPISVAVQRFNFQYGPQPELIQATSIMAMVLPLVIFFLAQRIFMRGVVITGVEK